MNLHETSDKAQEILAAAVDQFPWDDREAYKGYLSQLHYYTTWSVPLLKEMLLNVPIEDTDTPFCRYLSAHVNEENGHEKIALRDLESLGGDIDDYPELPETKEVYEPQFFKVTKQNPLVALGYSHPLERLSIERATYIADIVEQHGKHCDRFLRLHAEVDQDHARSSNSHLDQIPDELAGAVADNMIQTAKAYENLLNATREAFSCTA